MSRLKLYWPEHDRADFSDSTSRESSTPDDMIIPFQTYRVENPSRPASGSSMMSVLVRAQVIRENHECPSCGHPVVGPIELNDASLNRNGMPIPGTATLVGFHCCSCDREWSV